MSNKLTHDLLICGGGVIGLSIAYRSAQKGWNVGVADSRKLGRAASWAGAGILPPSPIQGAVDPLEQLRGLSHPLHAIWSADLLETTGIDTGYRQCGGVYLARTAGEIATLTSQHSWWDEHAIPYECRIHQEMVEQEPQLASVLDREPRTRCWFLPTECQLRNPRHLQALVEACRRMGVTFYEDQPVIRWNLQGPKIESIETSRQSILADQFCIASGAWSHFMLQQLHVQSGILPIRGQMVLFQLPQSPLKHVLNDGHRYLVARDDGFVLAGSCEEEVGFVEETTDSMIDQLMRWAIDLLPILDTGTVVKSWAGLRPGSFDALPYLGKVPELENAYVAAGHGRHGLHLSTGTAETMVALMAGQKPLIDLSPFRVIRGATSSR